MLLIWIPLLLLPLPQKVNNSFVYSFWSILEQFLQHICLSIIVFSLAQDTLDFSGEECCNLRLSSDDVKLYVGFLGLRWSEWLESGTGSIGMGSKFFEKSHWDWGGGYFWVIVLSRGAVRRCLVDCGVIVGGIWIILTTITFSSACSPSWGTTHDSATSPSKKLVHIAEGSLMGYWWTNSSGRDDDRIFVMRKYNYEILWRAEDIKEAFY